MKYFDAHCHLQFEGYDTDREELFEALRTEEIAGLLVGTDLESSKKAVELAEHHDNYFASIGLHPNATEDEVFDMDEYRDLAENPKVVAIGECGLDNFRPENPEDTKAKQREVFIQHVKLAIEADKPLMIHARPSKGTGDAYEDLIGILQEYKKEYGDRLRGNIHFFVGGVEEAKKLVALDFTLSYTAVLTFTHDYDEVVKTIPLTHLLSETDSPYISPAPNRGKRNDPRAIPAIVKAIAAIRGEDEEMVRIQLLRNAERVFGIRVS